MFDIGWSELLVIGVVALIVVGPKDLPRMFRALGEFTGKARRMAREFQTAMNDAADQSGVNDIKKDLRRIANPKQFGVDAFNDATADLRAWRPDAPDGKPRAASRDFDDAEQSAEPELLPDPAAAPPEAPQPRKADAAATGTQPTRAAAKRTAISVEASPADAPAKAAAPRVAARKPATRKPRVAEPKA